MRGNSHPCLIALSGLLVACSGDSGDTNDAFTGTGTATDTTVTTTGTGSSTTGTSDATDSGSTSGGSSGATDSAGTSTTGSTGGSTGSMTSNSGGGSLCGDGVITGMEECDCGGGVCDAAGLGDKTCADLESPTPGQNYTSGNLDCNPASCKFITDGCGYCGDGEVNGAEPCEEDGDITETCISLGRGSSGPLTCTAECTIDTSECTFCAYDFTFENCPDDWTTGLADNASSASSWACGEVMTVGPMDKMGVWATNLGGAYNPDESSYIQSPALDFTMCPGEEMIMTIDHWHDFQGGSPNQDGGLVQISTNGTDWTTITPMAGGHEYCANTVAATLPPVSGANAFCKEGDGIWQQSMFDLSAHAGNSGIYVRLVLGTTDILEYPGWYIDRILIE